MYSNALNVMKAKKLGKGKFADGRGLWLWKRNQQRGQWFLRFVINGKRREMGLGAWPDVSIAEAREAAEEARKLVRKGIDPVQDRQKRKNQAAPLTLAEAIQGCFEAKQAELKDDGQAGKWLSSLSVHVIPKIGKVPVVDVDQHLLKGVLNPIWHDKPDAARKALNRLNLTLKHAAALGLDVDLQAGAKAKALLGKQRHVVRHIPSIPYKDASAFYKMLCGKQTPSCYALRFLMLTVARSGEVRFASYDEIDGATWLIPSVRTKTDRDHRIPLTKQAKAVIKEARMSDEQVLLFPSQTGRALSDVAMSKFMKDLGLDARPHGFRSTFRTWAEEMTDADREVKEAVLAHVVDGEVERAYQRSDRFKKRKALMIEWARFLVD